MALSAGTRLGPYEILAPLGAGGMGEVYRATDTKLKRQVAIKVLPESVAADPDRLARFQREAEVLASLNHPHIAAIYGLEETGGGRAALVMELVEGEDLAHRLKRGAIPVEEALEIAKQIAEGLEEAHEKGIVHRDLKPANVQLTPDGKIKILDFGLAKAYELEAASDSAPDLSQSSTLAHSGTQAGVILGTAAYMSPEQARGRQVDKRADIWAFGCVLYEMLTGRRAFEGENVTDTIVSVVSKEPDWSSLPSGASGVLRTYLRRCLSKEPRQRLHDVADIRLALEGAFDTHDQRDGRRAPNPRRLTAVGIAGAFLLGAAVAGLAVWSSGLDIPVASVTRLSIPVPGVLGNRRAVAMAPDGSALVYAADNRLFLRAMDRVDATPIEGTEGGSRPFFSSDGDWVGFFSATQLKKVALAGGVSQVVADVPVGILGNVTGAWGPRDRLFLDRVGQTGIFEVSASGGTPEAVTTLAPGDLDHSRPAALPGGEAILFTRSTSHRWDDARIERLSLDTGGSQTLVTGGADAQYVETGHLVYARDGSLFAVPFDLGRGEVTGASVQVVESVRMDQVSTGAAHFSVSKNGSLAYVAGAVAPEEWTLVWVDRSGLEEVAWSVPGRYDNVRLAPGGTRVTLDVREGNGSIWIADLVENTFTRLTFGNTFHRDALWTPDRYGVIYGRQDDETGSINLFSQAADGTGDPVQLTRSPNSQVPVAFVPDGTALLFAEQRADASGWDLEVLPLIADGAPMPVIQTEFSELNAAVSPDGQWIAYQSDESGQAEIYVRPFPDVGAGRWQVSTTAGRYPLWGPEGRELFYVGRGGMMQVTVRTQSGFAHGRPELLFDTSSYNLSDYDWDLRAFDLDPASRRFLMRKRATAAAPPTEIVVVRNWYQELIERVPAP